MAILPEPYRRCIGIGMMFLAGLSVGCGKSKPKTLSHDETLLSVAPTGPATAPTAPAPKSSRDRPDKPGTNTAPSPAIVSVAPPLKRGEQFPLMRTVSQSLTQLTSTGEVTSSTQLEWNILLSVDETRDDGRLLMGVRFERVRYFRDIIGDRFVYDSHSPPAQIPAEVQPYHALIGHGFSYWIGPQNHVLELVGFKDFLQRVLWHVSPQTRSAMASRYEELSPEAAVAEFLDESIGLLHETPANPTFQPAEGEKNLRLQHGTSWTNTRRTENPACEISTRYTVAAVQEHSATIEMLGTINPGALVSEVVKGPATGTGDLTIRRGHLFGRCRIERSTGLPEESQSEQRLELTARLPNGEEVRQTKTVTKTLRRGPRALIDAPAHSTGASPNIHSGQPVQLGEKP